MTIVFRTRVNGHLSSLFVILYDVFGVQIQWMLLGLLLSNELTNCAPLVWK
eukprot:m.1643645 g.1643645  ORF g.1643645 m.1643645 type:complete len:51 (-) comp59520_c0_seq1:25-177(-)